MTKVTRPDQIPPPTVAPPTITDASTPFFSSGGGASTFIPILSGGRVRNIIVPPGGFAGFAQQTPATQALFQRAGRKGGLRSARKRRSKAKTKTTRRKSVRKRAVRAKKARLVKGSAAAKRYMASIRRKRKR